MKKEDINTMLKENKVNEVLDILEEELSQEANGPEINDDINELKNEATLEKEPKKIDGETETKDVYPEDEHKEIEDVKEVVVEAPVVEDALETNPTEKAAVDAGVGSDEPAEAGEVAEEVEKLLDSTPVEDGEVAAAEEEIEEVHDDELPIDTEESEEDENGDLLESLNPILKLINQINESVESNHKELEVPTEEVKKDKEVVVEPEEIKEVDLENKDVYPEDEHKEVEAKPEEIEKVDLETKDVYPEDEHKEVEDVKEVVVESETKEVSGDEHKEVETKPEEIKEVDLENKDVYPEDEHKEAEDVVEVVIEACRRVKESGKTVNKENIKEEYAKMLKEACDCKEPADKEFDVDAFIQSSEVTGNKEDYKEYEDLQGEGSEAAKGENCVVEPKDIMAKTIEYKSLKEACMLDDDYFVSNTYSIQTAEEKQARLLEQVSLLVARELNDPMYAELLRSATYTKKLTENLEHKYQEIANEKVSAMLQSALEN